MQQSLEPITRQTVSRIFAMNKIERQFQSHARGWFSVVDAGTGSQSLACSPCQLPGHLLVPVIAFMEMCGRNRTRTYDLCDVNAML